jgi:hypothetical protein
MTLEGIADHGAMRDFLYAKIREAAKDPAVRSPEPAGAPDQAAQALAELAEELRLLQGRLASLQKGDRHA